MDEKEKFREFVNRQYVKLKRVASVGSLLLLALNLAVGLYPFISHRFLFSNIYIGIPLMFFLIILCLLVISHIYVVKMGMYRTETKADMMYNPYSTYALTPKEEIQIKYFFIPIIKGLYNLSKNKKDKDELKKVIDTITIWSKGFIPKEHYPPELKDWLETSKNRRL